MSGVLGLVLAAGKGSRMQSDLPKVLHEVNGTPMIVRAIDALRAAQVDDICCVVGYRSDLVRARLGDSVRYAEQTEQRGTGHAVMAARGVIEAHQGPVVVVYGDAPLLRGESIKRLCEQVENEGAACALLSFTLETPPAAGRIIRDADGEFVTIVEDQDCTPKQKKVGEINVGVYCFDSSRLLGALALLGCNNAQGEYYLTDIPAILSRDGKHVAVVETTDILETLGVNDPFHLKFAESVPDLAHAESVLPLIDAALEMGNAPPKE